VVAQNLGKMTPDDYLTLTRLQFKGLGDNITVYKDEPLGRPGGGHLFEFVATLRQMPVRTRQFILLQAGSAYVITALAPADQFEGLRARLEESLASVTLKLAAGA